MIFFYFHFLENGAQKNAKSEKEQFGSYLVTIFKIVLKNSFWNLFFDIL